MSIESTQTIDLIGVDKNTGKVILTIADHLTWDSDEHLMLLQEKLNSYLRFIESGELLNAYPDAKGRRTQINIAFKYPADERGTEFLSRVAEVIEDAGIDFEFEVNPQS